MTSLHQRISKINMPLNQIIIHCWLREDPLSFVLWLHIKMTHYYIILTIFKGLSTSIYVLRQISLLEFWYCSNGYLGCKDGTQMNTHSGMILKWLRGVIGTLMAPRSGTMLKWPFMTGWCSDGDSWILNDYSGQDDAEKGRRISNVH